MKTPPGCLEQVPFTPRRAPLNDFLTPAQVPHRDFYPFRTIATSVSAGRRHRPCSVLIALQDHSGLKLYDGQGTGFVVELSKGDVLIFAGDMPHNGLQSRSEVVNFRLFGYFPTIWSEVPWSTKGCEESGISVDQHEVKAVSLDAIAAQLNALESAVSKFDKGGGGGAKRSAVSECSHCGGRHLLADCCSCAATHSVRRDRVPGGLTLHLDSCLFGKGRPRATPLAGSVQVQD